MPSQLEDVLAQFVLNHPRFPSFHSFTALIKKLYIIQAGPNAPEMGRALFASHEELSE